MAQDLFTFDLSPSTLVQNVDNLLLCSSSLSVSQMATSLLLNHLGHPEILCFPPKTQLCSPTVVYLGVQFSLRSKTLTSYRV